MGKPLTIVSGKPAGKSAYKPTQHNGQGCAHSLTPKAIHAAKCWRR